MDVTLMYFDDCPNWKITDAHLRTLQDEIDDLQVSRLEVTTPEAAERHQFRGSPSLLVKSVDPFADESDPVGLSCRVYQTPSGPAGSPTLEQLREAISHG